MAELGIVASIIQIADVGLRLSLRLYSFGETAASADKAIVSISKDVSLTSSVLQELGEHLKKDRDAPICSENAIKTAEEIGRECLHVFQELDGALEKGLKRLGVGGREKSRWISTVKERLRWPLLQPKMELLRTNLDRLRVTLLLMLNVMIYARQCSLKTTPDTQMEGQRRIIEDLARLKDEFTNRLEPIASAIEASATGASVIGAPAIEMLAIEASPMERAMPETYSSTQMADVPNPSGQGPELDLSFDQIPHYSHLINTLLEEVDIVQNRIDTELRTRIWNDIVHTHRRETTAMKNIYGYERLQKAMSGKAWDLVRPGFEANNPATISAVTSSPDISQKRTRFLAHTSTAETVGDLSLPEAPESPAISLPEIGQLGYSPPGTPPSATSPRPTSPWRFQSTDEDAAMSPPPDADMSAGPEFHDLAYQFEVKESDNCLPLANIARIMKKALPSNATISLEAKELMQECVSELISFVSSEAADINYSRGRKTVRGEEVLLAFQNLGFENYAEALTIYLARYRGVARDELAAELGGFQGRKEEQVERFHAGMKEELVGSSSDVNVASRVARDSDEDAHVMETKVVDECGSVVDELLAQWTTL